MSQCGLAGNLDPTLMISICRERLADTIAMRCALPARISCPWSPSPRARSAATSSSRPSQSRVGRSTGTAWALPHGRDARSTAPGHRIQAGRGGSGNRARTSLLLCYRLGLPGILPTLWLRSRTPSRAPLPGQEGVPDEAFMVLVLDELSMAGVISVARYRAEFDASM